MTRLLRLSTWIVDISEWEPDPIEWATTLALFSAEIQAKIRSYHHQIDAKRSLIGKLLVHRIVSSAYSIPWDRIKFRTSSDGKPYLDTPLPPGCRFTFNLSHDGSIVACCFSEERVETLIREVHDPDILLSRGDGADEITDNYQSHEIGLDVMEYKLPRNEKTVDEFRSLLEEHLSPKEKMLIDQRRTGSHPRHLKQASVLDGLLQIWTFKEAIIKALGCGLRMDLSTISLSDLISHPEIDLTNIEFRAAATGQKGFTMPDRSSQLVVSFDGGEDRHWKFWSAVFPGPAPPSMLSQSKYILAVAVKSFSPTSFSSETPLIHSVTFKTVAELLSPC
ncbi:hypothetical protein PCASD_06125 [Puccinia coronata f. sp. avenae]|uniref:holo-[acyl-carrier-protein] synthase n=1 Tax=Puccinia coronata f. sp. avenae TaxID=200324 RepID=A0A2N5V002_9BASI|nr:hypothetical protein PCASD_06125 [Puccinia coronata f. sp. avenae]